MRTKCFPDTDTLLVNFSDRTIAEAHDLGEMPSYLWFVNAHVDLLVLA